MSTRVFVDGQEGTTGLRIHEYLAQRSDIEVLRIDAGPAQGPRRARPPAERGRRRLPLPARCGRARGRGARHESEDLPDRRQHGASHRRDWVFGLPELAPDQRAGCARPSASPTRAAMPRLHPAGAPARRRRPGPAGARSSATSITGYSGGGKKMIEQYEAGGDARLDSPRPYGLALAHKHLPEMTAHVAARDPADVRADRRQLLQGPRRDRAAAPAEARPAPTPSPARALAERYAGERFIRVMPLRDPAMLADGYFDVQACNDTNRADIFVFANDTQVLLMCATRQPRQGRQRRRGAVHERAPRPRRGHAACDRRPLSRRVGVR